MLYSSVKIKGWVVMSICINFKNSIIIILRNEEITYLSRSNFVHSIVSNYYRPSKVEFMIKNIKEYIRLNLVHTTATYSSTCNK